MHMKYLILLNIMYLTCQSSCPTKCNCFDNSVLCMDQNLEKIPNFQSLTIDPIIIDLSGNKIYTIGSDDFTFDKSYAVKEVYLNNSELLDIDYEAFDELENLQELYLGENLLKSIPENMIRDLLNLVMLDISSNYFNGDMPTIRSESLEVLAIANSKVNNIPVTSLRYLPNLKILLLQQNNIKSIDPAVFAEVTSHMFFVRLSYNVWDCTCDNLELFNYLAGKKFIDTSEPYQCYVSSRGYVDIFSEGGFQIYKNGCVDGLMNDQEVQQNSAAQEMRDTKRQREENNNSAPKTDTKPYSLIKENDTKNKEENVSRDKMAHRPDIIVTTKESAENNFKKECLISRDSSSKIGFGEFLIVACSFLIGFIFGYLVFVFKDSAHANKLDTSDSKTKLIPS